MIDEQYFSESEQLYAFLDGELEATQEQTLFNSLASSEILRAELKDLLAIRSAVQSDDEAFTPPLIATRTIFSELGFTPPIPPTPVVSSFSFRKLIIPAIVLLFSSLATGIVVSKFDSSKIAELASENNRLQSVLSQNSVAQKLQSEIPKDKVAEKMSEEKVEKLAKKSGNHSPNREILPPNDGKNSTYYENAENSEILPVVNQYSAQNIAPARSYSQQLAKYSLISSPVSNQSVPFFGNLFSLGNNGGYPHFWAELRGINAQSYPSTKLDSPNNSWFVNSVVGGFISFSDNFNLGIEVGREPYAMVYDGVEHNYAVHYEQHPLITWAGLACQYRFSELDAIGGLQPYGQLVIGEAQLLGPTARLGAGFYYTPTSRLSMSLGLEGSLLQYHFQNSAFYSQKLGFTYGVSLQF